MFYFQQGWIEDWHKNQTDRRDSQQHTRLLELLGKNVAAIDMMAKSKRQCYIDKLPQFSTNIRQIPNRQYNTIEARQRIGLSHEVSE